MIHACVFTLRVFALQVVFTLCFCATSRFYTTFLSCKAIFHCVFALQGVFTLCFCAASRFYTTFLSCKAIFHCVFVMCCVFRVVYFALFCVFARPFCNALRSSAILLLHFMSHSISLSSHSVYVTLLGFS